MTKKFLAALLCVIMVLALLPAQAFAGTPLIVFVAGNQLTENQPYVNSAGDITEADSTSTEYNVLYADGVLHLNGLTVTGSTADKSLAGMTIISAIFVTGNLTIDVTGDSMVTTAAAEEGQSNIALYVSGNLTLQGDGKLTATAGAAGNTSVTKATSAGVYVLGDLRVKSGTLEGNGGTATAYNVYASGDYFAESAGVSVTGTLAVSGGALKGSGSTAAESGECSSYGIKCIDRVDEPGINGIAVSRGTLEGIGGDDSEYSYGIYAQTYKIDFSGGKVTGTGGKNVDQSSGIFNAGHYNEKVYINGGSITVSGTADVTATGGNDSGSSLGLSCHDSLTVSGGKVTASGGNGANTSRSSSRGISSSSVTVSGGTVSATGNNAKRSSCGIAYASGFNVNGGTVFATGSGIEDGKYNSSYGVFTEGSEKPKFESGRLAAETKAEAGSKGALKELDLSSAESFRWRTSSSDPYTESATTEYAYAASHTYVDFRTTSPMTIAFTTPPANTTVTEGSINASLTAVVSHASVTLDWFLCNELGTILGGSLGTGGTFAIPKTLTAGIYYYLCQASYLGEASVKSDVATVTVTAPLVPTVTKVTVTPSTASVAKGGNKTFTASVTGTNSPVLTVSWTVEGGAVGTAIDSSGKLTIAANEMAMTLTVKATSTADPTKVGMATVTVTTPTDPTDPTDPPTPPAPPAPGGGYDYAQPEVTVYNDPSQPNATIWLSGSGLTAGDQLITERNPSGSDYSALLKLVGSNDVFATYNIHLKSGNKGTGGALHLTFDLNEKFAGQVFTLVHKKADGTYEYFNATANASGDLTFGPLYELSPFMLVKGTLNVGALGVPDTGDNAAPLLWPAIALLGLLGAAAYIIKRKRA